MTITTQEEKTFEDIQFWRIFIPEYKLLRCTLDEAVTALGSRRIYIDFSKSLQTVKFRGGVPSEDVESTLRYDWKVTDAIELLGFELNVSLFHHAPFQISGRRLYKSKDTKSQLCLHLQIPQNQYDRITADILERNMVMPEETASLIGNVRDAFASVYGSNIENSTQKEFIVE